MRRTLLDSAPSAPGSTQELPAGFLDALKRPSGNPNGAIQLFSSFPEGVLHLTEPHSKKPGVSVNKFDLVCPRPGCGSVILKAGIGEWLEKNSAQFDFSNSAENILPALPPPQETCQWWLITPSPMQFENIGFSRGVSSLDDSGPRLKLLACAECDLGPLGWSEEGGNEFWLACARVAYKS